MDEKENSLNRFVFYGEWIDNIKSLPIEQQDKIIAEIVRYGIGGESAHADDVVVQSFVNFSKGAIDKSKSDYMQKVEAGKKFGRKKVLDDSQIYQLAREGKNSTQIAEILGVSKSSIDHSQGWSKRKEAEFKF